MAEQRLGGLFGAPIVLGNRFTRAKLSRPFEVVDTTESERTPHFSGNRRFKNLGAAAGRRCAAVAAGRDCKSSAANAADKWRNGGNSLEPWNPGAERRFGRGAPAGGLQPARVDPCLSVDR